MRIYNASVVHAQMIRAGLQPHEAFHLTRLAYERRFQWRPHALVQPWLFQLKAK